MIGNIARVIAALAVALVVLVGLAAGWVYFASNARLNQTYAVAEAPPPIPTDAATVTRGKHLAAAVTHCTGCHTESLAGQVMVDAPPFKIVAPNLTTGAGGIGGWSDADLVRAIRHGVDRQGRSLLLMPANDFHALSAEDLTAIVAYLKSVPPVANQLPPSELRPLGRALLVSGNLNVLVASQIDHSAAPQPAIAAGVTPAYGGYLTTVGGCQACHGPQLAGGVVPDGSNAHAPAIGRAGLTGWTEAGFITAMRTGVTPQGAPISPIMPWRSVGQLTDDELRAVWAYLQSQP